jgi:hypothetical protein
VPSWSWLLVLVLDGRRLGLGPVHRVAPALDVAELCRSTVIGTSGISAPEAEQGFCLCISLTWR